MNWTAQALRERFAVFGRFYEARVGGRVVALRSHLEIFEHEVGWPAAIDADADLVAVMMNPGASRPLDELDARGWAETLPDRTQYQLMKLALHAQAAGRRIRHVRVINLSDLRTPKSALLFEALADLGDDRHSIFSPGRGEELAKALGKPGAARAVGYANSQNPNAIVVPCHRVIGSNGTLTGYAGGLERKHWLLVHEGAILL